MNKHKVLMTFFLASEALFFIALIIAYVYYTHGSSTAKYLDINRTAIFTFALILSSVTMHIAGLELEKGKRNIGWLVFTIILGIVFLIGQGTEYARLYSLNITLNQNLFGSSFFTLTGFHGLHVLLGLTVLSVMAVMIYSGSFKKVELSAFKSATMYWHFVDGVWIVVFSVVYLWTVL
jgi:heme/copper-type cytochrome/quinol oxidase subunit 3